MVWNPSLLCSAQLEPGLCSGMGLPQEGDAGLDWELGSSV